MNNEHVQYIHIFEFALSNRSHLLVLSISLPSGTSRMRRDGVNPADVQRTGDNNESSSSKHFAEHTATEAGMDDFRMLKALVLGIKYYDS